MAGLPQFDAKVDRFHVDGAAELFRWLWPDPTERRTCVSTLANSIRLAQAAGDSCWSVTMFADKIRLTVGQVEVLFLGEIGVAIIYCKPLEIPDDPRWDIRADREIVY